METKVEALEGSQKKLTVTVDAKDIDSRIKKTYKDFAYKYNFPGFRKGKAPRPVIDNMLGTEAVPATVTDDLINELYPKAMDENELVAVGKPEFDQESDLVEAGKPFTFSATVECRPEFELDNYDPVEIKLPAEGASDAEIEAQIEELRNYYYDFKDCPAVAKLTDHGYADISMHSDDASVESLNTDSRLYEVGSGLFPDSFDKALIGMKKGDKKTIEVDMSKGDSTLGQSIEGAGKVSFDVEVKQVKEKILPEVTDEWAKETAGFDSLAELRERVAENVKQQKERILPQMRENEALYALQERLQGEAPAGLCEEEEQNLLQNFFQQVQQQGMTFDAYLAQMGMTPEQFKEDLKKQAKDVAEQDLALDAWARHTKIQVSDEEISAEFEKSGAADPKALEKEWREAGRIAMLRQGIKRSRALEAVLETVKVEEFTPGVDDEKKPAAKKTAAKKSTSKASTSKTAAAKKTADKKPAAKADTAKKPAAKKTAAKKDAAGDK